MKVLITGATGLVGKELVALLLQNGIAIHYLTTSRKKIEKESCYHGFFWNPEQGIIDENCLLGVDVIVHLAGASITKRWTSAYKEEIIESRILSSNLLYKVLKENPNQVRQIISASAIGIYPDSQTVLYSEESKEVSDTFLGNVVFKWEDAVDQFRRLHINVCKLRFGLVLSNQGGVLMEMLKPIKKGMAAGFGSGKQFQSWIHIHDLADMIYFAMDNNWTGVYNAVAPNPVTSQEMIKAIADAVNKEVILPNAPRFMMKLILGDMHILLFESQKVSAQKALDNGFQFKYKFLDKALDNLLRP